MSGMVIVHIDEDDLRDEIGQELFDELRESKKLIDFMHIIKELVLDDFSTEAEYWANRYKETQKRKEREKS